MVESLFSSFTRFSELRAVLSQRQDGSMRLSGPGEALARLNRENFFQSQGINPAKVVSAGLVHGSRVAAATAADVGSTIAQVDGLISSSPGTFLSITVADCLPIYFYDPVNGAIGIAHAGWRGAVANIVAGVISAMTREYATEPQDLLVGIGPGICSHHFEVQDDVAQQFTRFPGAVISAEGKLRIDLRRVAQQQLLQAGVREVSIEISEACTHCDAERYFSFRRDKPAELQAMVAAIGISEL